MEKHFERIFLSPRAMVLRFYHTSESPGQLVKLQTAGPHPQSFCFRRSEVETLRIYISDKSHVLLLLDSNQV